jgi:dehydrodolichyl diphosphate syntase complex subunit NUS1
MSQPPPYTSSYTPPTSVNLKPRQKPPSVLAREQLVLPHLPPVEPPRPTPVRTFLKTLFFKFVLLCIHFFFSIYLRVRYAYNAVLNRLLSILYYHHRTPELIAKDVSELKRLNKLPAHISVILERRDDVQRVIDETAEIACWCAAAGIKRLSVYEQSGVLKQHLTTTHRCVTSALRSYFGRSRPSLGLHTPQTGPANFDQADLMITFLSAEDGRESIVDLTKTLCDMAQRGKIAAEDVSVDLIDAELKENVMDEPDLLILFSGDIRLQGYPPWQIRLTEIL